METSFKSLAERQRERAEFAAVGMRLGRKTKPALSACKRYWQDRRLKQRSTVRGSASGTGDRRRKLPATGGTKTLEAADDYVTVEQFFEIVVKLIIEGEYGYRLAVVDGKQAVEESTIDQDIFSRLRRSGLVIADLTGVRPNCFLELGYALGRSARAVVTFQKFTAAPFDVTTYAAHVWKRTPDVSGRRARFREHLESIASRAPIVNDTPLIP